MVHLVNILEAIKNDINSGTIDEIEAGQEPLSYVQMKPEEVFNELSELTEAVVQTVKQKTFTPLKIYLSWMCRLRLANGTRLADIMALFDVYEKSMKDAMSLYLATDLVSLNRYRREMDTLLDKARVYVSDYFFKLYEETVFKQVEQLRTINEITSHLTSSLKLNEVLDFIVENASRLFIADCGSILLLGRNNIFSTEIATGWQENSSADFIVQHITSAADMICLDYRSIEEQLKQVFQKEDLDTTIVIKLHIQQRVIGVLVIGFRESRTFTPSEYRLLETFANQAAIAVHNAQQYGDTNCELQERIREVTILLEQSRALLDAMREGVIAIDAGGRVNLVNNEAQRLLNLPADSLGELIKEVFPDSRLPIVIKTRKAEYDQEQKIGSKVIITNRVPVIVNSEVIGAIATFRDRQDVKLLAEELIGVKSLLESMRAQSHEFLNKLHAISGLIEMEQYGKVVELIRDINKNRQECVSFIVKRIKDQATAGLLLGKISQSIEQGLVLRLKQRSNLKCLPPRFSNISMVTVLGNLISNAMDAVANVSMERRVVEVYIFEGKKNLTIAVTDCGCGIPVHCLKRIFQRGFSTKVGNRGIGLALVKQEVEVSGGRITVHSVDKQGSTVTVKIPVQ
jgi:signal transduction histidine kinase